ncbi:MAG TPA: CAP domain-containing protein [Ktedonobacteraceae bacterium]|nr:CAP domain-containing protein [Ktedonobacteraceae bacterium]
MKKMYSSLATLLFLCSLSLVACTGLPVVTTSQQNPSATASGSQTQGTAEEQQLAQRLFKQINQDRASNGLPPLAWEPKLENSAHQHDLVMAGGCGLMHQCPNESDLGTRISKQGVQWQTVGENIGEGGPVTTNNDDWNMVLMLHQGMMAEKPPDDGHRRNLLSQDFHRIGISIYIDAKNTLWLTEDFAN